MLIAKYLNNFAEQEKRNILAGLSVFAGFDYAVDKNAGVISLDLFQESLSKINEKEQRLKNTGVYFTPVDVAKYIVANTFCQFADYENLAIKSYSQCLDILRKTDISWLINARVFDPTCGTAEFLLTSLELKFLLHDNYNDEDILLIVNSIYGNDIAVESLFLSKIRIFFAAISRLTNKQNALKVAHIIERNFTTDDYIIRSSNIPNYDIIVGNPPYAEYSKINPRPLNKYGNVYADVLQNSIESLQDKGCIGFVIPISFVSTARMSILRQFVFEHLGQIYVLNYADRPDCLFNGVHQKLTILIGIKATEHCKIFSSSYKRWYKQERQKVLDDCDIFPIVCTNRYIPKIGNKTEWNIYEKIKTIHGVPLAETLNATNGVPIYLNMRGCFWIKAFSFNPGSNEYKQFISKISLQPYILSILNSSLYFFFWSVVSDCWHITINDLSDFIVPISGVDVSKFSVLSKELEERLESTKKYIGSKQVEYEYKHRECKDIIDKIDESLGRIYHLTKSEIEYLKRYELNYRMSNGKI